MEAEAGMQNNGKTLSDRIREGSMKILEPVARVLLKAGVGPNFLSLFGFLFALAAGVLAAAGRLPQSGCLFLLSGLFDAVDGTVARVGGRETRFGAFFDSFLDRYSESALFAGILYGSSLQGRHDLVLLSVLALAGSYMVSYARARAEGLGIPCRVGFFSRMERVVVLVLALVASQLFLGLAVLAVMANATALQRLRHVARQLEKR